MNDIIILIMAIFFIIIIVLTGRYFYILEVKAAAKKLKTSLQVNALDLNYSFEQMIFFHSLPSNIPAIKNAKKENLVIEFEYRSAIFQQLQGIKIYVKSKKDTILLAFLPTSDFRFPTLDSLYNKGEINKAEYLKIATYRLIHPKTLNEITEEVYKQMKVGRYQITK